MKSLLKSQRLDLTSSAVPTISADPNAEYAGISEAILDELTTGAGNQGKQSLVRSDGRLADQGAGQNKHGSNARNQKTARQHRSSPTQPGH